MSVSGLKIKAVLFCKYTNKIVWSGQPLEWYSKIMKNIKESEKQAWIIKSILYYEWNSFLDYPQHYSQKA